MRSGIPKLHRGTLDATGLLRKGSGAVHLLKGQHQATLFRKSDQAKRSLRGYGLSTLVLTNVALGTPQSRGQRLLRHAEANSDDLYGVHPRDSSATSQFSQQCRHFVYFSSSAIVLHV